MILIIYGHSTDCDTDSIRNVQDTDGSDPLTPHYLAEAISHL